MLVYTTKFLKSSNANQVFDDESILIQGIELLAAKMLARMPLTKIHYHIADLIAQITSVIYINTYDANIESVLISSLEKLLKNTDFTCPAIPMVITSFLTFENSAKYIELLFNLSVPILDTLFQFETSDDAKTLIADLISKFVATTSTVCSREFSRSKTNNCILKQTKIIYYIRELLTAPNDNVTQVIVDALKDSMSFTRKNKFELKEFHLLLLEVYESVLIKVLNNIQKPYLIQFLAVGAEKLSCPQINNYLESNFKDIFENLIIPVLTVHSKETEMLATDPNLFISTVNDYLCDREISSLLSTSLAFLEAFSKNSEDATLNSFKIGFYFIDTVEKSDSVSPQDKINIALITFTCLGCFLENNAKTSEFFYSELAARNSTLCSLTDHVLLAKLLIFYSFEMQDLFCDYEIELNRSIQLMVDTAFSHDNWAVRQVVFI